MRRQRSIFSMITGALLLASNRAGANPTSGYSISNSADGPAQVMLYGSVGDYWDGVTAKQFAQDIKALGDVKDIEVRMNSNGGSVIDGAAIYNTLSQHQANVTVYIDGMALSIASVIAMAADTVKMAENAWMMVHSPSTCLWGNSGDLRKEADLLDRMQENTLLPAYRNKTGKSDEELNALINAETWLDAKQALELGFVDEIVAPNAASAAFDPAEMNYRNMPLAFVARFCAANPPSKDKKATKKPPVASATPPSPENVGADKGNPPNPAQSAAVASATEIIDLCTLQKLPMATAKKLIANQYSLEQARFFTHEVAAAVVEATAIAGQHADGDRPSINPLIADAQRRKDEAEARSQRK